MGLKDHFRRSFRQDRTSSDSSSSKNSANSNSQVQTAATTPSTTPTTSTRSSTAVPPPAITLTKTNTTPRLSLSRTFTFGSGKSKQEKMAEKHLKKLEVWEQKDKLEWSTPEDGWRRQCQGQGAQGKGKRFQRSKQHQDILRAFEFNWQGGRRRSVSSWISGISPGCSRVGSVDGNARKGVGSEGKTGLSRQVTREDADEGPLGEGAVGEAEVRRGGICA